MGIIVKFTTDSTGIKKKKEKKFEKKLSWSFQQVGKLDKFIFFAGDG